MRAETVSPGRSRIAIPASASRSRVAGGCGSSKLYECRRGHAADAGCGGLWREGQHKATGGEAKWGARCTASHPVALKHSQGGERERRRPRATGACHQRAGVPLATGRVEALLMRPGSSEVAAGDHAHARAEGGRRCRASRCHRRRTATSGRKRRMRRSRSPSRSIGTAPAPWAPSSTTGQMLLSACSAGAVSPVTQLHVQGRDQRLVAGPTACGHLALSAPRGPSRRACGRRSAARSAPDARGSEATISSFGSKVERRRQVRRFLSLVDVVIASTSHGAARARGRSPGEGHLEASNRRTKCGRTRPSFESWRRASLGCRLDGGGGGGSGSARSLAFVGRLRRSSTGNSSTQRPWASSLATADGPGRGALARVEHRGALVLLGLAGGGRVAAAADALPGAERELVLAVEAVAGVRAPGCRRTRTRRSPRAWGRPPPARLGAGAPSRPLLELAAQGADATRRAAPADSSLTRRR